MPKRRSLRSWTMTVIGKRPSAPIASRLLDPQRAEHVELRQPLVGALDVVGIVFPAGLQPGHPGDQGRIHALGALDGDRAVAGEAVGVDVDGGVDLVVSWLAVTCRLATRALG